MVMILNLKAPQREVSSRLCQRCTGFHFAEEVQQIGGGNVFVANVVLNTEYQNLLWVNAPHGPL